MKKELKEKVIKFGDSITYEPVTENYGRAEFILCPVFKRGYIRNLFIYPKQQVNANYYSLDIPKDFKLNRLWFSAIPNDEPKVWDTYWCSEHKCYSIIFYVPVGVDSFNIGYNFGNSITLDFHK